MGNEIDANAENNREEIEGLATGEDLSSLGDYPIDTVLIRNESRTVHDVLRRIEKDDFIMDPDFQREFIWSRDKQSKLIESVIMRIPLPVFYLAENRKGKMIVVDGLQRLSTFQHFVKNKLQLKLEHQPDLHKKYFKDLPPKLQNRIEDCNLILYVIDSKVPQQALLDIFERVNGGVALTRQQMRNCLFAGPATHFIRDAAKTELFLQATGGSLNPKTMRDREMINRFCAFRLLDLSEYKGDMDDFLARALEQMNQMGEAGFATLATELETSLRNNMEVYGMHAFRKRSAFPERRNVFNASLWDIMSTGLCQYPEGLVKERAGCMKEILYKHIEENQDFNTAITISTNDTRRVVARFQIANQMFREVLGDQAN